MRGLGCGDGKVWFEANTHEWWDTNAHEIAVNPKARAVKRCLEESTTFNSRKLTKRASQIRDWFLIRASRNQKALHNKKGN